MNTGPRPTSDTYFLNMATVVATRATCLRRAVGCVLVDQDKHVLSTGYNGRAAGLPHCNNGALLSPGGGKPVETIYPNACRGACAASGTHLDECEAIHAEQNALLQCPDVRGILTCYCTTAPCIHCVKLLLNTGCRRIVFRDPYPSNGEAIWTAAGRRWDLIDGLSD